MGLTFPEHIPEANSADNYITDYDGIVEEPADTMITELLYDEASDETEPDEVHAFMTQLGMEIVEEEQAVEILVGWRQQRENLSKEQLKRGFGPSTPDVKSLEKRVRCYICPEVGHFSKNCRKPRTGKGGRKGKSKRGVC